MKGYTKLFQDIVTSTIWREPDTTRIVWITLLALSGEDGVVSASVPGLAAIAGVSMEKTLEALDKLKEPDKWSRTKDHEGRRIEETDGGWKILNHGKYRAKMNYEDRKVYLAEKQKEYREREKKKGLPKKVPSMAGRGMPLPGEKQAVTAANNGDEGLSPDYFSNVLSPSPAEPRSRGSLED